PHEREFERLAGPVGKDRVAAARRAAKRYHAVVLLKGHCTVIADESGRTYVQRSGRSWPATAGSGDVLSGMIGALLAAGLEPAFAAACAALAHDEAAAIAASNAPTPASGIVTAIPEAVRMLRGLVRPCARVVPVECTSRRGGRRPRRDPSQRRVALRPRGRVRGSHDGCREGRCLRSRRTAGCSRRARCGRELVGDRKSTRLNSSHVKISYA